MKKTYIHQPEIMSFVNLISLLLVSLLTSTACTDSLTDDTLPLDGARTISLGLCPPAKPGFEEKGIGTRSDIPGFIVPTTDWQEDDRILAQISLQCLDASPKMTDVYTIYTTLQYTKADEAGTDFFWKPDLNNTGSIYCKPGSIPNFYHSNINLPLLTIGDNNQLLLNLPQEVINANQLKVEVNLSYAPGMEWNIVSSTNPENATINIVRSTGTDTGNTEFWTSTFNHTYTLTTNNLSSLTIGGSGNDAPVFTPIGSRLRIYTGQGGDQVTLTCPLFTPANKNKTIVSSEAVTGPTNPATADDATDVTGSTYTATTDDNGNAYFYGFTPADTPLDGIIGNSNTDTDKSFTVIVQLKQQGGTFTDPGILIFKASHNSTVQLPNPATEANAARTFVIDASFARPADGVE
ncbi:hypothetical protein AAE250_07775 [Bacteroides sp. GD17]|uniref:hypothetical protein n=1 Tax=Bacteroides sp. GD17 TaxID=3139826 RepID=UPI00313E5F65